ncbi:MAG: transposase, partial [Cyanobacteria bacterium P01_E01_bin.6]
AVVLEGELLKKWRTPAVPEQLASQLKRYFPGANLKTVYEAGFSGFVLHRELESAGIESIVVNASSIETTVHNRVKTDKRDAFKLATQLAAGRLKGIRVPSREQEAKRLVTRTRQQLVEERTAVKNKLRMKCHQWRLLDATDQRRMSQRLMKEMLERSPSDEFRLVMEAYWQVWQTLEEQIKKLDKELERYRQLK